MAIGTSNVSFSAMATELGATANSNVSLQDLGRGQIILNPGNSRQTYTLSDSITLTTEDSATADNMNMGGSSNYEVSEFKSLTINDPIVFSSTTSSTGSESETVNVFNQASGSCQVLVRLGGEIYCKRVGTDLVWYVGGGANGNFGNHNKEGSAFDGNSSDVECARLGIATNSTHVSVSATTLENTTQLATTSTTSSGSTSSELASTNTKIGFDCRHNGTFECAGNNRQVKVRLQLDFTVSGIPLARPRTFRFFVGMFGLYSTTIAECC